MIDSRQSAAQREIEKYLAQSTDLVDLEHRQHKWWREKQNH